MAAACSGGPPRNNWLLNVVGVLGRLQVRVALRHVLLGRMAALGVPMRGLRLCVGRVRKVLRVRMVLLVLVEAAQLLLVLRRTRVVALRSAQLLASLAALLVV